MMINAYLLFLKGFMMKKIVVPALFFVFTSFSQSNLVEVKHIIPDVILDIKYATEDNFTKQKVYPSAKCYLLEPVVHALQAASKEFNALGYTIKIWDGYRPLAVQRIFWDLVHDERYVAEPDKDLEHPQKGSRHNRGCAVDLTLVDKDGKEVDMGTKFDDFSERAHRDCKTLPQAVLDNRKLLEDIMKKHGFEGLPTEWWHFDYKGWDKYPLLNIAIDKVTP